MLSTVVSVLLIIQDLPSNASQGLQLDHSARAGAQMLT